jgi:hypothetical protein
VRESPYLRMEQRGNRGTDEKYPQKAILRALMLWRSRVYVLPAAQDTGND